MVGAPLCCTATAPRASPPASYSVHLAPRTAHLAPPASTPYVSQAKFGMAAGTAVTVGVAVVTVPPLVAVMGPAGWAVGGVTAVGVGGAVGYKAGHTNTRSRTGAGPSSSSS